MTAPEVPIWAGLTRRMQTGWPVFIGAAALTGYISTALLTKSVLASDAILYADRADSILAGNLPYFDALYEHLPLAVPLMLAPRLVPGSEQWFVYVLVFGLLMVAILILLGRAVGKLADAAGIVDGTERWMLLVLPLVPFLAFRTDPLSTLLAVVAIRLAFVRPGLSSTWIGIAGIATKGWPALLAPIEWWAGRRRNAVVWGGFAVILVGSLLLTPGFQEGREFAGIHLETVTGSILALFGSIFGSGPALAPAAGATYVAAPLWALAIGPGLAAAILWQSRRLWQAPVGLAAGARLAGVITWALLVASPLLSAQYLLWLTPWLIFFDRRRVRVVFFALATITLGLLSFWDPVNVGWQAALAMRNVLLVVVGVELAIASRDEAHQSVPAPRSRG